MVAVFGVSMAWFGPGDDHTYYRQAVETARRESIGEGVESPGILAGLFNSGQKKSADQRREDADKSKRKVAIRYFAPQVIGVNAKGPKSIRMGAKLIGFLMNPIDTREPSLVRALLPHGGEAGGAEIEKGSVLYGQFSYAGASDKVQVSFSRLDTPDGLSKKIAAVAVDASDYTVGLRGEEFTGGGVKLAAGMGLTMFSGMADVLTEKESLSGSAVQAKPTMKNALLQGFSRAAQDEAGRTKEEISSAQGYVVIQEGKEMIIQLTEDYRNE